MPVDLNLLRPFLAVLETGSVTAAAAELHLTQPTVSHALGRLRKQVGDPLFVRQGSGLVPTDRALELGATVRASLARLDAALSPERDFDPSTTTRRFRLCLSDVGEASFLPSIMRRLTAEAPHASIVAVPTDISEVTGWLRRGEVEAAVASVPLGVEGVHTILPGERYVAVMAPTLAARLGTGSSAGASPDAGRLNAAQLASVPHIAVDRRAGHEQLEAALDAIGVRREVALRVQHFSVLPQLVATGAALSILPAQMAQTVAPAWGLSVRELPRAVPSYDVNLYWDPAVIGTSGPLAWFVGLLRGALTGLRQADPAPDSALPR